MRALVLVEDHTNEVVYLFDTEVAARSEADAQRSCDNNVNVVEFDDTLSFYDRIDALRSSGWSIC